VLRSRFQLCLVLIPLLVYCNNSSSDTSKSNTTVSTISDRDLICAFLSNCAPSSEWNPPNAITISGQINYEYPPLTSGGLQYASEQTKPVRFALILSRNESGLYNGATISKADGTFSLTASSGSTLSAATAYTRLSFDPGFSCTQPSNGIKIVDNTSNQAYYLLTSSIKYSNDTANANLLASLSHTSNYSSTSSARPFALFDNIISAADFFCSNGGNQDLPLLLVNWSDQNTNTYDSGLSTTANFQNGTIGTSFYVRTTFPNYSSNVSQLFILGQEDVDTDEFDPTVIAHEFCHYLENRIWRSDSPGGAHSINVQLDPRLAFSEGFCNGYGARANATNTYMDSSGTNQADVLSLNTIGSPQSKHKTIFTEDATQLLAAKVLANEPTKTISTMKSLSTKNQGFITLNAMVAEYANLYGFESSSVLYQAWTTDLQMPANALCNGSCGSVVSAPDYWDTDNDLGSDAATKNNGVIPFDGENSEFWKLYETISLQTLQGKTIAEGSSYQANAFSFWRYFRITEPTGASRQISLSSSNCSGDNLDLYLYLNGEIKAKSEGLSCSESITQELSQNEVYIIAVQGMTSSVSSFDLKVE
jgi:hypothetical protein